MPEDRTSTNCQLFLVVPPDLNHDMAVQVAEAGSFGNIACALLQCEPDGRINLDLAEMLLRFTRSAGVPLLFEKDIAAAGELGADGAHIPVDEDIYNEARQVLGENSIIGVECGLSRHDALTLGELGADYVAFKGASGTAANSIEIGLDELIRWWSETVIVPCVAWDTSGGCTTRRLADAGADFVARGSSVWSHPEGPVAAVRLLMDKLSEHKASA